MVKIDWPLKPERLLKKLTPSCVEPYHPVLRPISEAYRYIVRYAGVRSGNAMVEGARIAVHDVMGLLQNGETVDGEIDLLRP